VRGLVGMRNYAHIKNKNDIDGSINSSRAIRVKTLLQQPVINYSVEMRLGTRENSLFGPRAVWYMTFPKRIVKA
jgi:hypothetical protein